MTDNYAPIIAANLDTLFRDDLNERAAALNARLDGEALIMPAFGHLCRFARQGVFLDDHPESGPRGVILSLYALHAVDEDLRLEPFKAFKEMPNSMPYQGAFRNRTEMALVKAVEQIEEEQASILAALGGSGAPASAGGDFSLIVRPLPKIALCYLFYAADDDFSANVTCLYSNNAAHFMPTDGLADVGEYTSKRILELL